MTDDEQNTLLDAAEDRLKDIYDRLDTGKYKLSIGAISGIYTAVMLNELDNIIAILPNNAVLANDTNTLH